MAKKYYDDKISLKTDWGGDSTTGNLPVVGSRVQEVIKEGINSKVGYVGRVEKTGQGFYVLTRDEEVFNNYLATISDENPFGDLNMDGVNGRFDAPFNYKMNITLINPESGYKSTLLNSTGNIIKFKAETLDNNNTPQSESMTITFKIKNEGGVETTYTSIYDGNIVSQGIEYNLDGKLGAGINTITITAVGMNTGISAMRRITYRLIDMYFTDKFDISKRYQFTADGTLAMNIGYDLKGVGKTKILWYFDGNQYATDELTNMNPTLSNTSRTFYFTDSTAQWLTPGIHNIQMSMVCKDNDSGEEFQTPIYYREFIVEKTPTVLNTPFIVRKTSFDASKGFLAFGEKPTIYGAKQFENVEIEYAAYYNGKSTCNVTSYIKYSENDMMQVSMEDLPLIADDFSEDQKLLINLINEGLAEVILRAYYKETEYFETAIQLEVASSDMNITTVSDSVVLDLNAFGRSNNASGKDVWEYKYVDAYGQEQCITTDFSKNEYVVISTYDNNGNIVPPSDANDTNSLIVDALPNEVNDEYKYLIYNNEYYVWNREFDWSDTSGWSDNKLKLANGNAITINYKPFSEDKLSTIKSQGFTFEIEYETTNVYNDDAVICRICGNENFTPGIVIYASGAELVISREIVSDGENAGYTKRVSTKYKAEESNRISFVITPDSDNEGYRNRILSIYVNGELCGAYAYDHGTNFFNDSNISFRGSEDACINISSIKIYERALSSNEILSNYIYYRTNANEKAEVYKRNDIMLASNDETFDPDKLKSQLPVMMIYQTDQNQSLDDIHQEKKNKKLTRFFDVVYIDIQNPSKNFLVKNAYITPQGTSSMNYPVKNLRLYTGKKDSKSGEYYSRLFVGSNIFIDGSPSNLSWDNINLDTEVKKKRQYAFKDGAIPVNCWCLKADFAESSSSHNTGTSRYWNQVLKNAGFTTKAQVKAAKYYEQYPYDIRTAIDGFPIVVFYQSLDSSAPRFEGKYNFNNDKSTESVFGFTGGIEIEGQEVKYYYIGKEKPIIQYDDEKDEWGCSFESGAYTENPTTDSPLYASKILADGSEEWYMLRGKELLDNPKMECWELLNSVNEIALFKTMIGFGPGDGNEKIGIVKENGDFDGAFESRYPDCGDYYHYNSLKRFGEWLVSCRYLDVDSATGLSVPFVPSLLPSENYYKNTEGKLSICSLTKQVGQFEFNFPGYNFYCEVDYNSIASNVKNEGYQQVAISDDVANTIGFIEVERLPETKIEEYEYIKYGEVYYTWMPSNVLVVDELPSTHESSYDYVLVGETYYVWANTYNFEDFHNVQWVDDTAFNRALKFAVEKYDHIEMNKMAAYYIYLMRFGGVDQTVKNSMLTTEGPATDDANSTLPSLWYFINYDNDTILGVKNDGRLVFDPYITRETKDGTGYVYAGRESTLWNNLEADAQFMAKVTEVDNKLAEGGSDPLFSLSFANALREYDTNQSDKWCERIYNKDAERKYIDTYVKGWVQKVDKDGTETHVYEDYLYDVQGSRTAHRKWWLGRRFNVFDSRFCNANFRNQLIKFRSTNLPAGSSFSIVSGEPIFYAWGHDNAVTAMTPTAIQPGETHTFTTNSAFNIGSYLELMGAANISTLDLRNCVGALTELDVTGCYSPLVGTKMKEILVGDHKRSDLVNISNTSLKFSGLDKAVKLEVLDMTNIKNAVSLDGLNTLLNVRELYAKGTSIANFTFADGAIVERIELPSTVESLSLTRSSSINYANIAFENGGYGRLTKLTIDNCSQLMNDPKFALNWITSLTDTQKKNASINLQGIDWTISDDAMLSKLLELEKVGTTGMAERNIRGTIRIASKINNEFAVRLQNIFGPDCFKEGSKVYIDAPTAIYINMPETVWEGDAPVKCEIITVGTKLDGVLSVNAVVRKQGEKEDILVSNTDSISLDISTLNNGYITIDIKESNVNYEALYLTANYTSNIKYTATLRATIKKRIYPEAINIITASNSFINDQLNIMELNYTPSEINDKKLIGRGLFAVTWDKIDGTANWDNKIEIIDGDKETAYIQAPFGFDGLVTVKATITRIFDGAIMCETTKQLEFRNPNTIITSESNPPLYNILVKNGIIQAEGDEYGKLTKDDASKITMADFVKDGKSIFAGNTELTEFLEFEWFIGDMGKMPIEGLDKVNTPDGMFAGCTNLKKIALPDNFEYSAKNMFNGCKKLEAIYGPSYGEVDVWGAPIYKEFSLQYIGEGFTSGCTMLHTCKLTGLVHYIGLDAFKGCSSLTDIVIPSNSKLTIERSNNSTPFVGCVNATFIGAEYGEHGNMPYCVKDGACYGVKENGDLILLHMGQNTSFDSIPTNVSVYISAYACENRTESSIVIPANVVMDGYYIFNKSVGDSIQLNCIIGDNNNNCNYLFNATNYKGNYRFAYGETKIPVYCFHQTTGMTSYAVPEGVTSIGTSAFYSSSQLNSIVLPSTLRNIGASCFWLTKLKTLTFLSETPPSMFEDILWGNVPDAIYVKPEAYDNYKTKELTTNKGLKLIAPFITPTHLYDEGYVRFIKDGQIYFGEDNITFNIGQTVELTEISGDYFTYYDNPLTTDLNVYMSQYHETTGDIITTAVGQIQGKYTTIYLGDNSSLFSGEGLNLRYGIYHEGLKEQFEAKGWFYDARFEGVRSNPNVAKEEFTEIVLDLPELKNLQTPIVHGLYAEQWSDPKGGYSYVADSNNEKLLLNEENGYDLQNYIDITNGTIKIGFAGSNVKTGLNGMVINEIGEVIYSDPELMTTTFMITDNNENNIKTISLDLISDIVVPNTVYVTVTDGKAHTYRKYWNGEKLYFNLPCNMEFVATASSFVSENGKGYYIDTPIVITDNVNTLIFTSKTGIELHNDILSVYTNDYEYHLDINCKNDVWSSSKNAIDEVEVDEVILSDANGFENTKIIANIEPDSIFAQARKYDKFENGIIGYIPSYIELELFKTNINEINHFLVNKGKPEISLENLWTSEAFDKDNSWTSDGNITSKDSMINYYIFGKRIIL